jgi:hypothetical protein
VHLLLVLALLSCIEFSINHAQARAWPIESEGQGWQPATAASTRSTATRCRRSAAAAGAVCYTIAVLYCIQRHQIVQQAALLATARADL